jgi:uncharacterized membrane protein YecN with MAPEG domain
MTTAIVCTALLAGLLWVLSIRTSRLRGTAEQQIPTRTDDPLFVAMRVHGNLAENAPMLSILMLIVGFSDPPVWVLGLMVLATAARFAHAIGTIQTHDMAKESPLRLGGAIVTTLAGFGLAIAAVVVAGQVATEVVA